MSDHLETSSNQFGFKQKHGTDQGIFVLKEMIDSYVTCNSSVFTCFLDASKAYDRVNHRVLFTKLVQRGLPGYLARILAFWYSHQTMCVRWGSVCSQPFNVSNGVRQGGILSPYLFNVYVDDLSKTLNTQHIGLYAGTNLINHIMYADDIVVVSPSSRGLQTLLRICEEYGASHDIKFNTAKSMIMIFRCKSQKEALFPKFVMNQLVVSEVSKIKYLGHVLNNQLTDDDDILRQRRQLYARGNMLLRNFSMCSLPVKLELFRAFCSNIYCSHLWWNFKRQTMIKLFTSYHNILKMFIGISKFESTSQTCAVFGVSNCSGMLRKMYFRFIERLCASNNSIISSIENSSIKYISRIRNHWSKSLYSCYM